MAIYLMKDKQKDGTSDNTHFNEEEMTKAVEFMDSAVGYRTDDHLNYWGPNHEYVAIKQNGEQIQLQGVEDKLLRALIENVGAKFYLDNLNRVHPVSELKDRAIVKK